MSTRDRVGVLFALALLLVLTPAAASAQTGPIVVEVVGGGALLDTKQMYPGYRKTSDVRVTNTTGTPGTLRLRILDLASDDNGCNRPEARVDTTCGPDQGELDEQVTLTVERLGAGALATPATTLDALGDLGMGQIDPGETVTYRLTFALPMRSGNETQTDLLDFRVEIAGFAEPDGGGPVVPTARPGPPDRSPDPAEPVVAPDEVVPGDGDPTSPGAPDPASPAADDGLTPLGTPDELEILGRRTSRLPRTGRQSAELATAGLAALGIGAVALGLARVRRRLG